MEGLEDEGEHTEQWDERPTEAQVENWENKVCKNLGPPPPAQSRDP